MKLDGRILMQNESWQILDAICFVYTLNQSELCPEKKILDQYFSVH